MANKKMDGVIEAVRYTADGRIYFVRAYERRGAVWSDQILLDRKTLGDRLARGKRFVTGHRKSLLGSVFVTGEKIQQMDGSIITSGETGTRDRLSGVPVF